MLCIYLLYTKPYAALVSQTEQILPPKIQKLRKYYLSTDYVQKHDEKFKKLAIPIRFTEREKSSANPAIIYLFQVNNRKFRKMC